MHRQWPYRIPYYVLLYEKTYWERRAGIFQHRGLGFPAMRSRIFHKKKRPGEEAGPLVILRFFRRLGAYFRYAWA